MIGQGRSGKQIVILLISDDQAALVILKVLPIPLICFEGAVFPACQFQGMRIALLDANKFGIPKVVGIGSIVNNTGAAATYLFLNDIRNQAALTIVQSQLRPFFQCTSSVHSDTPCKSHLQVYSIMRCGQFGFADASLILSSRDCQISRKVISGSRSWET